MGASRGFLQGFPEYLTARIMVPSALLLLSEVKETLTEDLNASVNKTLDSFIPKSL